MISYDLGGNAARHVDAASAKLCFQRAIANHFIDDAAHAHVAHAAHRRIPFDRSDLHDVRHERCDAIHVALNAIERGVAVRRGSCKLYRKLEPRQRGPQLVRDVAEQPSLAYDEALKPFGHAIEGEPKLADLVLSVCLD